MLPDASPTPRQIPRKPARCFFISNACINLVEPGPWGAFAGYFHDELCEKKGKEQTKKCAHWVLIHQLSYLSNLSSPCNRSSKACTLCPEESPNHGFAITFEFSVKF